MSYPDGNGITLDTDSGGTKIYGNICYGNGGSGINAANYGNDGIEIYNNTCYNNGVQPNSWGRSTEGNINFYSNRGNINIKYEEDITVKNNIMSDGWQFNLISYQEGAVGSHVIDYNLYHSAGKSEIHWGSTNYTVSGFQAATVHEDNAVEGDPLFVRAGSDFHLQSGSPAIDAGTTISGIPAQDIEGTTRPQGPAWDIGAYEYGSVDLDPPDPPSGLMILGP